MTDAAPFVVRSDEPLVGVRGFQLSAEGELLSVVMPTSWPRATVGPATCYKRPREGPIGRWYAARDPDKPDHAAPAQDCRCGFGAYHPGALDASELHLYTTVTALVIGYGRVLPGTKAWRASYARVVALLLPRPSTLADLLGSASGIVPASVQRVKQVAEEYGIAVMARDAVRKYASEFGQVIPYTPDPPRRQYPS